MLLACCCRNRNMYIYVVLISCLLLTSLQANDQCQSSLSMSMVQHARTLFAYHDVAWRNWDETRSVDTLLLAYVLISCLFINTRRLTTNLDNCKQVISRIKNMTMRFQVSHIHLNCMGITMVLISSSSSFFSPSCSGYMRNHSLYQKPPTPGWASNALFSSLLLRR